MAHASAICTIPVEYTGWGLDSIYIYSVSPCYVAKAMFSSLMFEKKTGLVADPKDKATALRLIKAYCVVFLQYHLRDDKDCLAQSYTQYTRRTSLEPTGRVVYYLYFVN